jgi:hypothetical protein
MRILRDPGDLHILTVGGGIQENAFGGVHALDLVEYEGISNMSALGNVYTVTFRNCNGTSDVSALGCVHALDLNWYSGISNQ